MVSQSQIDEVVKLLVAECHPEKIVLFGSHANGSAKADSDLDIALVKPSSLPMFKRGREVRSILRSNGRRWTFPMDILVYTPEEVKLWESDPYSMLHEIFKTGKVLYESKQPTRLAAEG